ncbi:MAG: phosphotransferase [Myxococcota bacterium]|nr:phosphotransferase [Myxococcota bacterium]
MMVEDEELSAKSAHCDSLVRFMSDQGLFVKQGLTHGKLMLCDPAQKRLVKVGTTALGRALVLADYQGWRLLSPHLSAGFETGDMRLLVDSPELVAIEIKQLPGKSLRSILPPHRRVLPLLATLADSCPFDELLEAEQLPRELCETLLQRHGNPKVTTTPSHGDYIYWNVLASGTATLGLIDFEYASKRRYCGFDDFHFRFAPWWFRGLRRGVPMPFLGAAARWTARQSPSTLSSALSADLFFVHWAAIRRRMLSLCEEGSVAANKFKRDVAAAELALEN